MVRLFNYYATVMEGLDILVRWVIENLTVGPDCGGILSILFGLE